MTGEAAAHDNDTRRDVSQVPSWPAQLYLLIAEPGSGRETEFLALCSAHWPPHIRHGSRSAGFWCQALPPHGRRRRVPRESMSSAPASLGGLDADQLHELIASATAEGFRRGLEQGRRERER